MEVEKEKKNKDYLAPIPFKIENMDLQRRGIVDKIFAVIGKNGRSRLRIKKHRITGDVVRVRPGNWQSQFIKLFEHLKIRHDPWNNVLEDLEGNIKGSCSRIQQEVCASKNKICNPKKGKCRKRKTKKNKQIKKSKTRKSKTRKSKTKKSKTKKSPTKMSLREIPQKNINELEPLVLPIDPHVDPKDISLERPLSKIEVPSLIQDKTKKSKTKNTLPSVTEEQPEIRVDTSTPSEGSDDYQSELKSEKILSTEKPLDEQEISLDTVQEPEEIPSLIGEQLEDIPLLEKEKTPSIKQVISPLKESLKETLNETLKEEEKEVAELLRQESPDIETPSKSISISKEKEFSKVFSEKCQTLIDNIKGNLKQLSIKSKEYQQLLQCTSSKNKEQLEEYKKIDKLIYPHLDDPNIALKLANKKEFRDVEIPQKSRKQIENIEEEANKICSPSMQFELEPHQKFVRNFLSFQSPYNSLLIFHGLGTGKTCSSISVCEEMRNYYQQIGSKKRIMIVASPVVQENYKLQLFDERKLKLINGLWNLKACTGNKFINEVNPMNTKGLSKEKVVRQIKKIIRQSYEFLGYTEFANKIDKVMKKVSSTDKRVHIKQRRAIEREFSGRLLVIDEVHNIRANDDKRRTTKNLQDLVSYSKNMKLLLLTATPMFNEATEIVWLINLMNLNDNRFPIKISDVFTKDNTIIEDESHSGKNLLIQKLNGYVSYVSGENPFRFPFRIFPFDFNSPHSLKVLKTTEWQYPTHQINGLEIKEDSQINYLDVYVNTLIDFQERAYNYLIKKLKEKNPQLQEKKHGIQYTMMDGPLQILNFAYPHVELLQENYLEKDIEKEIYGKRGLRRLMDYTKSNKKGFSYKSSTVEHFGRIFNSDGEDPPLKKYSAKIYEFIQKVKNSEGICLIYSNYIDGGCVPIALALEEMGIYRYNTEKSLFKERPSAPFKINNNNAKYIMITGDKKLSPNNKLELKAVTDVQNRNGEKVKVVIISKAGSEGLDFQNIRQVHILEPWYNLNRADQTIGRGVRNKSHCLLPFNKRTVEIYLHASELRDTREETIDMYMYRIAENKAIKIGQVTRLLKEHAVDCLLNKNQQNMNASNIQKNTTLTLSNNQEINYNIGHKDNSLICDFMECEYSCKPNDAYDDDVGIETYNENYIIMNIDKILNKIKLLFREHYVYEKTELIKRITSMKSYSLEQINMALDILINDDNEYLTDMLGRTGRLVNVDKIYMFQPIEIDKPKHLTQYYRRQPIHYKQKKIVIRKIPKKQKKQSLGIKIDENMELLSFNIYFNILITRTDNSDKKNWVLSCRQAIQNLVMYNNLPEEILVEIAFEHIFDSYSAKNKLMLLNQFELLKINKEKASVMEKFKPEFFTLFQKIIDKISITHNNIKVVAIVDYSKELIKHPLGIGFFKLNTLVTPNKWTTDVSGLSKHFADTLLTRYKIDPLKINNFIGFLTASKKQIVFKVKSISSSENKRTRFGQKLPTSGENKRVTVHRMNNVLQTLKAEKKYIMNKENTKIEGIYDNTDIRSINDMELAAELELVLRYLDINNYNDKKWFFNTLEDKINNVEKIKIENK